MSRKLPVSSLIRPPRSLGPLVLSFLALTGLGQAGPVLVEAGDLQDLLETTAIPSAASGDKYRAPTEGERSDFRDALHHLLEGDLATASDFAAAANYDVVTYTDTISSDVFTLLREKNSDQHWGGMYVIDQTPERALVVQCPHPLYDGARVPAVDLFLDTQATAYLQAGTHRNNSPIESNCDGDLGGDPYRISDMAHAPESLFQDAHEVLEAHFSRTVSLSVHGMADSSDPADVVVSNGSRHQFVGNSLSRALAARMNEILADAVDSRVAVSHQEPGEDPGLSGSTNVQGRVTNGSPNPCTVAAPTALFPERFLHLECDPDVRDNPSSNWAFVTQALVDVVPEFSDPEPDLPVGDLVITEIMANPDQVGDSSGEYLEFFNQTGAPITMTDWQVADRSGNIATFSGVIQPGALFVVGSSADLNGGVAGGVPDEEWANSVGNLTLTNSGDTISVLNAAGDFVTGISYGDGDPFGVGVSLELAIGNVHRNGQTSDDDHVASVTSFGADWGSPGTRGETQFPVLAVPLSVTASGGGADVLVSFSTEPAVTYTLWRSLDLESWLLFQGLVPVVGDGEEGEFTFPLPGASIEFYRLACEYAAEE